MSREFRKYLEGELSDGTADAGNIARRKYLEAVGAEDGFFALFDRSRAAKKGWETRKARGWDPKVGMRSGGGKIPTWYKGETKPATAASQAPQGQDGGRRTENDILARVKNLPEEDQIEAVRTEYEKTRSPEAHKALMSFMDHSWEG